MKTLTYLDRRSEGYALLMVLIITTVSMIVLAGAMRRTTGSSHLNDRVQHHQANINAAEAAVEKVVARMKYDFESTGIPQVAINQNLYKSQVPTIGENPYWAAFTFSDGQGHDNQTHVSWISNYTGGLPSQYPGLATMNSPVYRIVSNVRAADGSTDVIGAVQGTVMLALVPITQYAIFYNGLLEFSTCATMTVNGRVHANAPIYTGTSASLTFNSTVTTTDTITSPKWNGQGPSWNSKGTYKGSPGSRTNTPTVALSIGNSNIHSMIEMPAAGEDPQSPAGTRRLYNQAHVVLLITNNFVNLRIQSSQLGAVPGADTTPITLTATNTPSEVAKVFPFLSTTNTFTDQRESKTMLTAQLDMAKYRIWLATNSHVLSKFPANSGTYPTILFAANNRSTTSSQLGAIRVVNGSSLPVNGGLGFSLATPNPLYIHGNYNCTNSSHLASTNTSSTVPSALMSDALTVLSSSWSDSKSGSSLSSRTASSATTVNAAILTGIVPSTGSSSSQFSGGVHNITRLLESWSSSTLWLNTSIINLYNSTKATTQFQNPGVYYNPPTRKFSYDLNFMDPARQPPGIPTALVFIRTGYDVIPPNTIAYNGSN